MDGTARRCPQLRRKEERDDATERYHDWSATYNAPSRVSTYPKPLAICDMKGCFDARLLACTNRVVFCTVTLFKKLRVRHHPSVAGVYIARAQIRESVDSILCTCIAFARNARRRVIDVTAVVHLFCVRWLVWWILAMGVHLLGCDALSWWAVDGREARSYVDPGFSEPEAGPYSLPYYRMVRCEIETRMQIYSYISTV